MGRKLEVQTVELASLKPYEGNAKRHTAAQIDAVEASIREFGFRNPVIAWHNEAGEAEIVAGHGRCIAARNMGLEQVPCIFVDDLSDAQRRALALADNQTTMMTGWDTDQLEYELDVLADDFDMSEFGFDLDLGEVDMTYTDKTEGLMYEPVGVKPEVGELCDLSETDAKMAELDGLNISQELRGVLEAACYRFAVFDYSRIADYYANGTEEEKKAMEMLGLVIVDYGGKIEDAAAKFIDASETEMAYARRSDIE